MATKWDEQYDRAARYLKRLSDIAQGILHTANSQTYADDLFAFFLNCYHIKDWIRSDPTTAGWTDVEAYVSGNRHLALCADLCNAAKHCVLIRHRSTENPVFAGGDIRMKITDGLSGREKIEIAINYKICTQSGELDALDVARQCMTAWDAYLKVNAAAP